MTKLSYEQLGAYDTTSLSNRLIMDVNQLQLAVAMLIRLVVRAPFLVIGAVIMSMFLDVRLAWILIVLIPIMVLILYFYMKKTSPMYVQYQKRLDRFSNILKENLEGVRVIRSFSSTKKEKQRFEKQTDELQQQLLKVSKVSSLLNPFTSLIVNMAIVVLLWNGAIYIQLDTLDAGTMIAFINYASQILLALIVVSNLVVIFTKANASAKRVNEILQWKEEKQVEKISVLDKTKPAIVFKDVSFYYPLAAHSSLKHISFTLQQGKTMGVIGGTGSGKSTLVHLLSRLYKASEGEIFLFGVDVNHLTKEQMKQLVSTVQQQKELFSGTIATNLRWGNETATWEQIQEVCKIAQADEFIEALEDQYESKVEQGGANFSGGQKQRLCIARTLLSDTDILILDDSFSALDYKTDATLRQALNECREKQTKMIVSQRVSTIMNADVILVLNDGKMAGIGTHEELYEQCSVYREICDSQHIERKC